MKCLICRQAEAIDGFTSVVFERGEMKFEVSNVPARVCPNCGEAYVDEKVAIHLLQSAEERVLAGELNDVQEFELL